MTEITSTFIKKKVILLDNSGVEQTSILQIQINLKFVNKYKQTIRRYYYNIKLNLQLFQLILQVIGCRWTRFKSQQNSNFKSQKVAALVYDITDPQILRINRTESYFKR
jgi:hypothetical protein